MQTTFENEIPPAFVGTLHGISEKILTEYAWTDIRR